MGRSAVLMQVNTFWATGGFKFAVRKLRRVTIVSRPGRSSLSEPTKRARANFPPKNDLRMKSPCRWPRQWQQYWQRQGRLLPARRQGTKAARRKSAIVDAWLR